MSVRLIIDLGFEAGFVLGFFGCLWGFFGNLQCYLNLCRSADAVCATTRRCCCNNWMLQWPCNWILPSTRWKFWTWRILLNSDWIFAGREPGIGIHRRGHGTNWYWPCRNIRRDSWEHEKHTGGQCEEFRQKLGNTSESHKKSSCHQNFKNLRSKMSKVSCHALSHHAKSCHIMSHHITSCHVMSDHVTSYHVTSYQVAS